MKRQSGRDERGAGCGVRRPEVKAEGEVSVRLKREELEGANGRVEESLAVCRASRYTPKSTEHREAQDNRIRRPERDVGADEEQHQAHKGMCKGARMGAQM
ncbi:hypothetical protein E4U37_002202 [Claviceps purpurea]|nr:hypothetical protein E4U37_002202 [Claviceps purpurea]